MKSRAGGAILALVVISSQVRGAEPEFKPAVGERALLYATQNGKPLQPWCAATKSFCKDFIKCIVIDDNDGCLEMAKAGQVAFFDETGTDVLVLDLDEVQVDAGKKSGSTPVAEVRMLGGKYKGRKLYTPTYHLAKPR